jgi:hypothetical protein
VDGNHTKVFPLVQSAYDLDNDDSLFNGGSSRDTSELGNNNNNNGFISNKEVHLCSLITHKLLICVSSLQIFYSQKHWLARKLVLLLLQLLKVLQQSLAQSVSWVGHN